MCAFSPWVPGPRVLSKEHVRQFNELGCLFLLEAFEPQEAARMRARCHKSFATAATRQRTDDINRSCRSCAVHSTLSTKLRITTPMQDQLGDALLLWAAHFFKKHGDSKPPGSYISGSYWPLSSSKSVTQWLRIDDAILQSVWPLIDK